MPNVLSGMKSHVFWFKLHWSLFFRVWLTISWFWSRWWLGTKQVANHLNQWWPSVRMHILVSLSLNGLNCAYSLTHRLKHESKTDAQTMAICLMKMRSTFNFFTKQMLFPGSVLLSWNIYPIFSFVSQDNVCIVHVGIIYFIIII